jgi:hypothetical protein
MIMGTKTKIIIRFFISIIVGLAIALLLLTHKEASLAVIGNRTENLFVKYTVPLYFFNIIFLLVPAVILHFKGKKPYIELIHCQD